MNTLLPVIHWALATHSTCHKTITNTMTLQQTPKQALTRLEHAINAVLAATPQGEKAETGLLPNAFTEKAQLLATELAKQLEQHPNLDFNNIPPALAVKALDKLGLEALLSDALAGATEEDQSQSNKASHETETQPLIELTEPLDLHQQFAFQFFAGYLRTKLPENQYSALHNAHQKSLVFSNEVAHIEPKLLIGLSLIKTMLPYFSAKNSIQNLNCKIQFLDPDGRLKDAPIQTPNFPGNTIVCRHLVWPYYDKEKPLAYSSEANIQHRVSPQTELLAAHESFYLVHWAKLGKWLYAQAAALNKNKTPQTFLLASNNHAMAIHLRLKTRAGKNEHVLTFYDPNNTTNHIKLRKPSADGFHDLTLSDLIPKNSLDAYFPFHFSSSGKFAHIYPAPQNKNERAALLAKQNQPTVPKALLGYDLEDLEHYPETLTFLRMNNQICDKGIYRWLFERAKNSEDGPPSLAATFLTQSKPNLLPFATLIADRPSLVEAWLDQEIAVTAQEKSEASLGTFHQHMANAQQVFLKLERITTQPICLKFPGMVLKKLNTLDTLANQEGWEPNALAALQNLKTELQQEQSQLDARANPTPPTPWQRVLVMLSCGLISTA